MAEITPRYEFRVWGQALGHLRDRLAQRGAVSRTESSEETYLVSAHSDRCNAKIRNHLMDIKLLVGTYRELEQWQTVLKAEFPLTQSQVAVQLFPRLELAAPPLSRPQYAIDELLNEVVGTHPQIAVVKVCKHRVQFSVDGCQAEFASTMIGGVARETVAVESIEAQAVVQLIRALGIDGAPNISYVRAIKQVLGR